MNICIVAECGVNHGGDMFLAKRMICSAKRNGADIAKFQLYSVDALFPTHEIIAQGRNWYEEVKKTELNKEQVFQLAEWCKSEGIEFMASCFDLERLGWLEEIGVKRHKLASRLVNDVRIIQALDKTGKPVIASVPYGRIGETKISLLDNKKLLYCIPEYPANYSDLRRIFRDSGLWNTFHGLSDHSIGVEVSMVVMSRGATIIEKHFCLKRDNGNPDMICSIEPHELKQLVQFARKVEEIL